MTDVRHYTLLTSMPKSSNIDCYRYESALENQIFRSNRKEKEGNRANRALKINHLNLAYAMALLVQRQSFVFILQMGMFLSL